MRKSRTFAAVLTTACLVCAASVPAFGAVLTYTPDKTSMVEDSKSGSSKAMDKETSDILDSIKNLMKNDKMTLDEIAKMAPGYSSVIQEYGSQLAQIKEDVSTGLQEALEEEKDAGFQGPTVNEVALTQVYHAEYKTYELSMAGKYFLYSNVGNGGLTHEPVVIDIPANITYTVEKDGLPHTYTTLDRITEKGTYVFRLMGIENSDAPLSEQKEYQSTFRFRIQDEPPVEETEGEVSDALKQAAGSIWGDQLDSSQNSFNDLSDIPLIAPPEKETEPVMEPETEPVVEPEPESKPDESEREPETLEEGNVPVSADREQVFDRENGVYRITLENGKTLTVNVPEGYIGSSSVTIAIPEEDLGIVKLYKNDQLMEFSEDSLMDYGQYRVELDGCSYFFTLAYEVGQMDYYPAPAGMTFTEAYLDGESLDLESERYVPMEADGLYEFVLLGESGERYETALKKDTAAPKMNVTTTKSAASIQYLSDDIASIQLMRDGEAVSGFNGTSIAEPGNYTLTVSDAAGNVSSANFSLKYQVNGYGILAVVLVILTIVGVVVFVSYIKKNTKVR